MFNGLNRRRQNCIITILSNLQLQEGPDEDSVLGSELESQHIQMDLECSLLCQDLILCYLRHRPGILSVHASTTEAFSINHWGVAAARRDLPGSD